MLSFAALTLEGAIHTCFDISNSLTSILSLTQSIQAFTPTNSLTTAFVCQGHHGLSFLLNSIINLQFYLTWFISSILTQHKHPPPHFPAPGASSTPRSSLCSSCFTVFFRSKWPSGNHLSKNLSKSPNTIPFLVFPISVNDNSSPSFLDQKSRSPIWFILFSHTPLQTR